MFVVLGLMPLFIVIAVVWPIVAIVKQQEERSGYTFTACIASWYAQIMSMVGIVVFTMEIGYLFKSLIGYLNLGFSYGPTPFLILGQEGPTTVAALEQQRQVDLLVREGADLRERNQRRVRKTIRTAALELLQQSEQTPPVLITEADLLRLPEAMQRYLRYTRIVGKEPIQTVRLKQQGFFRTQPGQKWLPMVAEEYFTTKPLALLWCGKIRLFPLISISAWDRFSDGHGSLLVKLLSLVPLADVHGPEADQGELLRYLGEIIWFPTAWLSDAIEWQAIDAHSVKVTIRQPSVTVSAVLHVNEQGQMTHLTAERSMAERQSYRLERWSAQCNEYQEVSGMLIPTRVEVTWNLESGDFSYFRGEITGIEYNQSGRVTVF